MGRTHLGIAAGLCHLEVVKYLLTFHKVNINQQDDYKQTALLFTAMFNQPLVAEYLVQQGADSSIVEIHGKTALQWSVQKNNDKVTEILKNENK